jgi:hypothetical protein
LPPIGDRALWASSVWRGLAALALALLPLADPAGAQTCPPGPNNAACVEQQQQRQQQILQEEQQRQRQIQLQQQQFLEQQRQLQLQRQIEAQRRQQLLEQQRQRQIEVQRQQQEEQRRRQIEAQQQQQMQEQERQRQVEAQRQQQLEAESQQQQSRQPPPTSGTVLVNRPDRRGFTLTQGNAGGHQIVVSALPSPDGRPRVAAYSRTNDPSKGTETRVYLDGRHVTTGPDFVTRSAPRQPSVTTHRDGLREAALPDGRPLFRERFTTIDRQGHQQRAIVRSVFAVGAAGAAAAALATPLEQVYLLVPFHGVTIRPYVPVVFVPDFYEPLLTPLAAPIPVDCGYCPPPVIDFDEPETGYADPVDLVADLVLAGAVADGIGDAAPGGPDPDAQALASEVGGLLAANDALQDQLPDLQAAIAAPADAAPVPVPEAVREQVRREVREDIALHRQQLPLSLVDIAAEAQARAYVFQVADLLDATDAGSGEACGLTTGDLLKFDIAPAEEDQSARMRVVTAKAGSCAAGTVVDVSLGDLQDMLNGFSQRVEQAMQKVHDAVIPVDPGNR